MNQATNFRNDLQGAGALMIGGAHDAVSAKIVESTGFDGIWLSSMGACVAGKALPDISLFTLTDMLNLAQNVVAVVNLPVIVDCESGYGDEKNVRYLVKQFERIGVAAVCIEDNPYPKRNSFYMTGRSVLPVDAMLAKLESGLAARESDAFLVVARTEALIAGLGVKEALSRARKYRDIGADAVVVHSRDWPALKLFLEEWDGGAPLVVIPTLFPQVSFNEMSSAGFKVVIYANQAIRAAISSMQTVLRRIKAECGANGIDLLENVASLEEIEKIVCLEEWLPDAN
jgi:phosphoenolpyruvate phosphomutase